MSKKLQLELTAELMDRLLELAKERDKLSWQKDDRPTIALNHWPFEMTQETASVLEHIEESQLSIDYELDSHKKRMEWVKAMLSQVESIGLDPTPAAKPPELGEYLLWYLPIPSDMREAVIGDLEEEYGTIYHRFGRRKAVTWYYAQVIRSFWPFAVAKIRSLVQLLSQGWVLDLLRRLIS